MMTMKKIFAILLIIFPYSLLLAQESINMPLPGIDSIKQVAPAPDASIIYPDLSFPIFEVSPALLTDPVIPAFDFSGYLAKERKMLAFGSDKQISWISPVFMPLIAPASPWLHSGAILTQAAYSISDKLILGGNSFGLNSIHSAPLPNFDQQQWDIRGASMFMQYKVNRNFTIETRVSVSGNRYQP